jgi:hypothetical protein
MSDHFLICCALILDGIRQIGMSLVFLVQKSCCGKLETYLPFLTIAGVSRHSRKLTHDLLLVAL